MLLEGSNLLALSRQDCNFCHGVGATDNEGTMSPCRCVKRAVFTAVYRRFKDLATSPKHMSHVTVMRIPGPANKASFGRSTENFLADFCLMSKRALTPEEHILFKYRYLLAADTKLIARRYKTTTSTVSRWLIGIEEKLGLAYAETQPYGLYPLSEYFATVTTGGVVASVVARQRTGGAPLRAPLVGCGPAMALASTV